MCLACEMDDLWLLYLQQQAEAAKRRPTDAAAPAPLPEQSKSDPALAFICEDPSGE
jgi:hypothetical protein